MARRLANSCSLYSCIFAGVVIARSTAEAPVPLILAITLGVFVVLTAIAISFIPPERS